jgi:hypothetical protein
LKHVRIALAQVRQISSAARHHFFSTTGDDAMLQLVLNELLGNQLFHVLEQAASYSCLPVEVQFILRQMKKLRGADGSLAWKTAIKQKNVGAVHLAVRSRC